MIRFIQKGDFIADQEAATTLEALGASSFAIVRRVTFFAAGDASECSAAAEVGISQKKFPPTESGLAPLVRIRLAAFPHASY